MPLFRTPMIRPPIMAPATVPIPPWTAAPPMNAAAMESSSKPVPPAGCAEFRRAVNTRPANAASTPMLTNRRKVTFLVLMPESSAAWRFPPIA
ncbi:hypothetical protein D9M70_602940 [compost metagenome]